MPSGGASAVELSEARALWLAAHALPHEPALRRWLAGRLSASGLEVDDVVQEVYAALAGLPEVAHIRDPRAYMIATARAAVLGTLRRARIVRIEAFASLDHLDADGQAAGPEHVATAHQQLRRTLSLIHALPEKCRQAFVLRRVEGLSQRQIAERMGISESTVEKHICKGIRLLGQALREEAGGNEGVSAAGGRAARGRRDRGRDRGA